MLLEARVLSLAVLMLNTVSPKSHGCGAMTVALFVVAGNL